MNEIHHPFTICSTSSGNPNLPVVITIPSLLKLREEGRNHFYEFQRRFWLGGGSAWKRSNHQIRQNGMSVRGVTTSMDYADSRFLLTGNQNGIVQIFDMSIHSAKKNGHPIIHELIQQASMRGEGAIRTVQWYPVDTGMFLTVSSIGSLRIWDTNAMECVLTIQPFQSRTNIQATKTTSIQAMHVSQYECTLAAVAGGDRLLKIVDLRSGASAHTLPSNGAVQCVQWSPVSPQLLFSCGRTSLAAIWDIRRPGPPLTHLDIEAGNSAASMVVSRPYSIDGSHWRRSNNKRQVSQPSVPTLSTANNSKNNVGVATAGVWDATGTHLVTVSGSRRTIDVWDLRQSPLPVRYRRRLVSENGNSPPIDMTTTHPPPVALYRNGSSSRRHDQMIWVAKGSRLCGYSMLAKDSNTDSGKPHIVLPGHLARIECILASERRLFTSAQDGLILVWEPCNRFHQMKTKAFSTSTSRLSSSSSLRGKRPRQPDTEDVDLW
jgi:WD40 repeat protein